MIEHMVRSGTDIEQLAREKISESGNPNMSLDDAVEEIVCNASERMLLNTKYAELMEKEKPNLFDAIRKWLSGLRDRIQKIFEGEGYSRENAYKEAKILWDVMDEMQEIWDRAMVQAQSSRLDGRQQRESGSESGTESGTGADVKSKAKFSLREKKTPTYEELVSKTPVRIVDVRSGIESGTYAEMKGEALEKAIEEKWFDEPHLNEDTNSLIFLTPKSFSHAFTNLTADFGEDTIRSMAHIPEIIKDAVLVSVNEPKNSRKAESGVYTFFGAINGANGIEPVKLTVKEYDFKSLDGMPQNIRNYFNRSGIMEQYDTLYDTQALEVIGIESIKEEPDASVKVGEQSPRAQDTSDSSEIKVADLLELVKGDAEKYIPERGEQFKGSSREYNYDYLASKDDMQLTEVVPKERYSRSDIVAEGMKNAAMFGYTNNSGNAVVYIKDTDTDVIVTEKSIRHGLDRRINNQAPVIEKLGEVLSNSVKVNELIPRTENTEKTFVYVGAAKDTYNRLYIATFIVNRNTNELESYDVLYAANAKKEPAALLPTSTDNSAMFTGSVISISDLLDKVNKLFPDILSEDVLRHFGRTERPQGKIGENVLYSSREMRDTAEEAKGREESAAALRRENRILRERIEYWKKQSRVTKEYTLRNTDTLEYARELVKRLDSAATSAEVNQGLQEMGAYLLNAENVDWDMLWEHALTLAHSMTDDADIVISDEMKAEREDFESFLKSVPVDVAPLVKAGEISYSDLKGYPIVHRKNGTTVDDLYQQLQERFGEEIFPDITDGGDMIDNIKRYADAEVLTKKMHKVIIDKVLFYLDVLLPDKMSILPGSAPSGKSAAISAEGVFS